jgi:hypothetical protein
MALTYRLLVSWGLRTRSPSREVRQVRCKSNQLSPLYRRQMTWLNLSLLLSMEQDKEDKAISHSPRPQDTWIWPLLGTHSALCVLSDTNNRFMSKKLFRSNENAWRNFHVYELAYIYIYKEMWRLFKIHSWDRRHSRQSESWSVNQTRFATKQRLVSRHWRLRVTVTVMFRVL